MNKPELTWEEYEDLHSDIMCYITAEMIMRGAPFDAVEGNLSNDVYDSLGAFIENVFFVHTPTNV